MGDRKSKLCMLPMNKIKTIMKKNSGVENVSHEAIFMMSKATEGFVALLLRQALKASDDKRQIDYPDLVKVTTNDESFTFLTDFIVPKIKGSEYLEILKQVEEDERKLALEDDEL